jgi:hypothetical protein
MLIVFRSSDDRRRWLDVKLENGYLPCLGSQPCNINEIDAAVWFKVCYSNALQNLLSLVPATYMTGVDWGRLTAPPRVQTKIY